MSWLGAPTPLGGAAAGISPASSSSSPLSTLRHRTTRYASNSTVLDNGAVAGPSRTSGAGGSPTTATPPPSDRVARTARGRRRTRRTTPNGQSHSPSHSQAHTYLARAYAIIQAAFRQFGEHCARNQIRTLIIDCLVMTNLFYPSFAMFLERRFEQPSTGPALATAPGDHQTIAKARGALAFFTTPLSETFFPPPPPLLPNVEWGPWWASEAGADAAWVPVSKAGTSSDATVQLQRVAWADVGDVLDAEHDADWTPRDDQIVSAVRALAEAWDVASPEGAGARCVRHLVDRNGEAVASGPCYFISPRSADPIAGGSMPLSDLWNDSSGSETSQKVYRGLMVPFHKPANVSAFQATWTARIAEVLAPLGAEVFTETYAGGKDVESTTLVSFSSSPRPPAPEVVSSLPPYSILAGYAILLAVLLFQLSNASKVHSRFGLAFTGVVQLCCSGVMSFSILSLFGWNGWGSSKSDTILPTYVLPFVVVVVGAENMSAMTKAVFAVPFTHSVPVRIGIGLSKVGTTIALTSAIDMVILGLVWLCVHLEPVRQFCVFAAVVIFTDWFMINTFFLTVLSIDAQRLELADVLSSPGGLNSAEAKRREEEQPKRRRLNKSFRFSWRNMLRARTAKSGSLLLLLVSVGALCYYTERGRKSFSTPATFYGYTPTSTSSLAPSARPTMFAKTGADIASLSASEALWRSINPQGLTSVRMAMPPSSIVVLPRVGHSLLPADLHKLAVPTSQYIPTFKPIWYYIKVGLAPQLLTCFVLYGVLAYLLKDSELLAAQRNRLGRGPESGHATDDETDVEVRSRRQTLTMGAGVSMLPASHESDVDVIASSADGKLAVSVGVDNSVCFWRFTDDERTAGTRELVSTDFIPVGDPIVGAAVSADRNCVAIATRGGLVQLWSSPEDRKTEVLGPVQVGCSEGRVTAVAFDDSPSGLDDPFTASPIGRPQGRPTLLVALSNGAIRAVAAANRVVDIASPISSEANCRVDLITTGARPVAVICGPKGSTMWRKEHGEWSSTPLLSSCEVTDRVLSVACEVVDWQGPTDIVVIGRRSGRIEVFDTDGEPMAATFGQVGEPVRAIAVAAPSTTRCTTCDAKSNEGFFVISSTGTNVYVDRVMPRGADSFCRCPPLPRRASALEDTRAIQLSQLGVASAVSLRGSPLVLPPSPARGRTASGGVNAPSSHSASPVKSANALALPSNGDFPLSSHGTRRLSGWREVGDRPPSPLDRQGTSYTALSTLSISTLDDSVNGSPARQPWADVDIVPLGAVVATDGGWAVLGNDLVGIRRAGAGIDDSQWEFWAVDLAAPWSGTSLLVDNTTLDVLERRAHTGTVPRHNSLVPPGMAPGTPPPSTDGEMPMRARRAERILSLNGRASFPSPVGSLTVATHPPLGYVAVRPFSAAGPRAVLAGFGNRVGVITLPSTASCRPAVPAAQRPTPAPAFNFSLSTPRIVTPRRQQFPSAPPPPRRAEGTPNGAAVNGTENGMANGSVTPSVAGSPMVSANGVAVGLSPIKTSPVIHTLNQNQ